MRLRHAWLGVLGITLAAAIAACGGGDANKPADTAAPAAGAPAGGGQKVDPATAGDVKGMIALDGVVPKNEPIKMNADPVCVKANASPQFQETYAVGSD